jgi:pimeloyl-ACP methyl ester carboxylesterase
MEADRMFDGVIKLADGCKLGFAEYGPQDGYPVVFFHGVPGSRFQPFAHQATREGSRLRVIVPERPGYGLSDVQHERTLSQHVSDVEQLLDKLGVERFSVAGASGGGPYALACAYHLGSRIDRAGIIAGNAPLDVPGMLDQYGKLEQQLFTGTEVGHQYVMQMSAAAKMNAEATVEHIASILPTTDQALLTKDLLATFRDMLSEAMRIPDGMKEDYAVLAQPWDFNLESIEAPVHLWHSLTDDVVLMGNAEYLAAHLPNSMLHTVEEGSHVVMQVKCAMDVAKYLETGIT